MAMSIRSALAMAPLRVSFMGGGTDIVDFYRNQSGAVVSAAINKYVYVHVKRHDPLFQEKFRVSYSEIEHCQSRNEIKNTIVRGCLEYLNIDEPLQISTSADLPSNSGLGSSSTFAVALLTALHAIEGDTVGPAQLAEEAYSVERIINGSPVGKQDQYAAAFGGLNEFQFQPNESVVITPLYVRDQQLGRLFDNAILVWTGATRSANSVLADQANRSIDNVEKLSELVALTHDFGRLLLDNELDLHKIGAAIKNGWEIKSKLSPLIANNHVQNIFNSLDPYNPFGYKLLGAGGGGFVFALLEKRQIEIIRRDLRYSTFNPQIDHSGARIIAVN